jgi:leucyl aminopeptidase (aminopeptidase T)
MNPPEAAKNALQFVLEATPGERLMILCDEDRKGVGEAFALGGVEAGLWTKLVLLKAEGLRQEPPEQLQELLALKPEIYLNLLRGIREETPFRTRLVKLETRDGNSRLGHCPGITMDMLEEGALALSSEEHKGLLQASQELMRLLREVEKARITGPGGTDLTLHLSGREFFTDAQINWREMKWLNLPTGEVTVGPVEDGAEGTLVCDGAIGGIGPLDKPLTIKVVRGRADEVKSQDPRALKRVLESLQTDRGASIIGEFAIGLNPRARMVKEFLETEKVLGTIHVAFGDNSGFPGGRNRSANHIDFLVLHPTVKAFVGGEERTIVEEGRLLPGEGAL